MTLEFLFDHFLRYVGAFALALIVLALFVAAWWALVWMMILGHGFFDSPATMSDRFFGLVWGGFTLCFGISLAVLDAAVWGLIKP